MNNLDNLIYILFSVIVVLFIVIIINSISIIKLKNRIKKFLNGSDSKNIEELMIQYVNDLNHLKQTDITNINKKIETIENKLTYCLQKVGIVKYNAFEDMGNNMSFSAALLDEEFNGFILTGIYSRESSYMYSKIIKNGKPMITLSNEEKQALQIAIN